jgi:hypothetical protein
MRNYRVELEMDTVPMPHCLKGVIMAGKKKKTAKVIPSPPRPRKVVPAAKVEYDFATCTCGEKIKLEPGPILRTSDGIHFPVLVGVICPECHADVRLGGESKIISPPGYD